MANTLIQMLDQFRENRDRAAEEGRFGDELPTLYSNGVRTRIYNDLGEQRYNLKNRKTSEINSYIGIVGGKCYLITPVISDLQDPIRETQDLGNWILGTIESGMPVAAPKCLKKSSGLKYQGTTIGVDNDAPVAEASDKKLIVNPIEQVDSRFGTNYLAFEISSPAYSALDIKEVLYKKFCQLQPPALNGRVVHTINKINSEELGYFLSN